jgi:hypothetical protein
MLKQLVATGKFVARSEPIAVADASYVSDDLRMSTPVRIRSGSPT